STTSSVDDQSFADLMAASLAGLSVSSAADLHAPTTVPSRKTPTISRDNTPQPSPPVRTTSLLQQAASAPPTMTARSSSALVLGSAESEGLQVRGVSPSAGAWQPSPSAVPAVRLSVPPLHVPSPQPQHAMAQRRPSDDTRHHGAGAAQLPPPQQQ